MTAETLGIDIAETVCNFTGQSSWRRRSEAAVRNSISAPRIWRYSLGLLTRH
jgi:hypothetical protein